jgi:uncharacterized protein
MIEPFARDTDPAVRGFLHGPEAPCGDALVLTHSAGSNCQSPLLVAVAATFAEAGFTVLRCDLPFRQARPHGPPRPGGSARDREGLRNAVEALRRLGAERANARAEPAVSVAKGCAPDRGRDTRANSLDPQGSFKRVFLGGHSYGGRQATMLAAADPGLADGLLLLSYPLHPPRNPSQLRTAHFPQLRTRALFVHGSRDPFGRLEELKLALNLIPATTSLLPIEEAGHDLNFGGDGAGAPNTNRGLSRTIVEAFQVFLEES